MEENFLMDKSKQETVVTTTYFNRDGKEVKVDGPDTFAKICTGKLVQHYVKRSNLSNTQGLLNPQAVLFLEGTEGRSNSRTGKPVYEYKKVSFNCFEMYLKFLQTGNPAHLRNAERELNNGY